MDGSKQKYPDASDVLWQNCKALMLKEYGKENISRFGADTGIKNGGVTRIRDGKSVGLHIIQQVARRFDLQAWQLLVPGLEPKNPPVITLTETEDRLYNKFKRLEAALKEEQ